MFISNPAFITGAALLVACPVVAPLVIRLRGYTMAGPNQVLIVSGRKVQRPAGSMVGRTLMKARQTHGWRAWGGTFLMAALVLWPAALAHAAESAKPAAALPASMDLRPVFEQWNLPLRSQGGRGTCSVFALTGAIEFALADQRHGGTVLSVEFLNWAAHQNRNEVGDGGYFSDLWSGFERYGICAETNWIYRPAFEPGRQPDRAVLAAAQKAIQAHLHLQWIKPWDVTTGLTGEQFLAIKRTLAAGWPVCGGFRWPKHEVWPDNVLAMVPPTEVFDGHSLLLVGYQDNPTQPGGGIFLIRNSGRTAGGAVPFDYARAYLNDAAWVQPKGRPVSSQAVSD